MNVIFDKTSKEGAATMAAWPRAAVLLVGVVLGYSLVVVGLCGAGIWGARVQTLRMTHAQASAIAAFSAAYTSRMYDLSDEVTRHLAQDLQGASLRPEALTNVLSDAAEATAQNDYLLVFGADGELIASSQPMRRFKVQEDALAAHRGGAARFIGQVVKGRATGEVIYRLSRRINGPDGQMTGIVGAAIRPFGIRSVGQRGPKDPQVTVWTEDGGFIAAAFVDFQQDGTALVPPRPADLGTFLPGQVKENGGLIRSEARVEGLPLWVSVEFDRDGILATWKTIAWATGALGAFLLAMGWSFAWAAMSVIARDRTNRAALEAAKSDAEAALLDREMLLREVHHRIRNSLMLVSSFLMLQAREADAKTRAALQLVQARVTSIGVVHETLYSGSHLGDVGLSEYLGRLLPALERSLGTADRGIEIVTEAGDFIVSHDHASALGLIVSEAVTNAVKYAFDNDAGRIVVRVQRRPAGLIELSIQDNGQGLKGESAPGLGSRLLTALAGQLGGQVTITGGEGTRVSVVYPDRSQ